MYHVVIHVKPTRCVDCSTDEGRRYQPFLLPQGGGKPHPPPRLSTLVSTLITGGLAAATGAEATTPPPPPPMPPIIIMSSSICVGSFWFRVFARSLIELVIC